ncbi:MAG: hypothetical protein J1F43_03110 [Muribaculaceae bacterium]|nr:hypothetical protein [Muribaculaceae bacterium]
MENIQLFDEYIAGSLNPEQRANFEKKLKEDKAFASDFKIYLFTVNGIINEALQDNADFENAMKHISKDELLNIIGRRKAPKIFRLGYFRERAAWASGIAALLIVCFVSIFFTWQVGNRNIDNMIVDYYYFPETKGGEEYVDINEMSKNEIEEYIPVLISQYKECPADDIQSCEDTGLRVALAYLKIHDRKQARVWLENLIERFWDDEPFVALCQKILDQID